MIITITVPMQYYPTFSISSQHFECKESILFLIHRLVSSVDFRLIRISPPHTKTRSSPSPTQIATIKGAQLPKSTRHSLGEPSLVLYLLTLLPPPPLNTP